MPKPVYFRDTSSPSRAAWSMFLSGPGMSPRSLQPKPYSICLGYLGCFRKNRKLDFWRIPCLRSSQRCKRQAESKWIERQIIDRYKWKLTSFSDTSGVKGPGLMEDPGIPDDPPNVCLSCETSNETTTEPIFWCIQTRIFFFYLTSSRTGASSYTDTMGKGRRLLAHSARGL